MSIPRADRARRVLPMSSDSRAFLTVVVPCASAPRMNERCEMDLSGGGVISPCMAIEGSPDPCIG